MIINPTICDLCGACISVCPADALILRENLVDFNPAKCTNCLNCVKTCPIGAVEQKAESLNNVE